MEAMKEYRYLDDVVANIYYEQAQDKADFKKGVANKSKEK